MGCRGFSDSLYLIIYILFHGDGKGDSGKGGCPVVISYGDFFLFPPFHFVWAAVFFILGRFLFFQFSSIRDTDKLFLLRKISKNFYK